MAIPGILAIIALVVILFGNLWIGLILLAIAAVVAFA